MNDPSQSPLSRGVYCLANDRVIEWFQAFIRSFRKSNPTLSLTVIPYDKSISRLKGLAEEFKFTIMEAAECSHFNDLEPVVMGLNRSAPMFRKWASFFGGYDEFIFLDSDIVVLEPLDKILGSFAATPVDLLYFDADLSVVYASEAIPEMQAKYGSVGFNAGAFVSRKGVIRQDDLMKISLLAAGERHKLFVAFDVGDQPFMNYVFDVLQKRVACVNQVLPEYAALATARQSFTYDRKTEKAVDATGRLMPFIHWPGCSFPTMVRPKEFLHHRLLGSMPLEKISYLASFYFRRSIAKPLKMMNHGRTVLVKCLTSRAWRKFYLCKLVGIKIDLPSKNPVR